MSANIVNQSLSVYIPFVFPNITQERIEKVFHRLNLGNVSRVDLVPRTRSDGMQYNMAFVYLHSWYVNDFVGSVHKLLTESENASVKISYDDPWYWNVFVNKKPRTINEVALERELAVVKAIATSEQNRADYLVRRLHAWTLLYPYSDQMVSAMLPTTIYRATELPPLDGYGHPFVERPNPVYMAASAQQMNADVAPASLMRTVSVDPEWNDITAQSIHDDPMTMADLSLNTIL